MKFLSANRRGTTTIERELFWPSFKKMVWAAVSVFHVRTHAACALIASVHARNSAASPDLASHASHIVQVKDMLDARSQRMIRVKYRKVSCSWTMAAFRYPWIVEACF